MRDLTRLLAPAQIAVVGATERHGSYGAQTLINLDALGFPGRSGASTRATRGARPALRPIARRPAGAGRRGRDRDPGGGRRRGRSSRRERSGAAAPSCYGAGFAEVASGRAEQEALSRRRAATGCRCAGRTAAGSSRWRRGRRCGATRCRCASPAASRWSRRSGNVAVNALAAMRGLRFHTVVSSGNQAVLRASDYLAALAADEDVSLDRALPRGRRRRRGAVRRARGVRRRGTPVVVLKVGALGRRGRRLRPRTPARSRATSASSGALVEEAGAVWARTSTTCSSSRRRSP